MEYKIARVVMLAFIAVLLFSACGPAQYNLNTSVIPEGGGRIIPEGGTYDAGTEVTLFAKCAPDYNSFDHWSGDATGTAMKVTITMDSDKRVTAHFNKTYWLTTSVSPANAGIIRPYGICFAGEMVTLSATPMSGYVFDHWSGDASGTSRSVTINMNSNKSVSANFKMFFSQKLSPACKGIGIPEAAAYRGNRHPVVLLGSDSSEHEWSDDLSIEWLPTTVEGTQLVACVGEERYAPRDYTYCPCGQGNEAPFGSWFPCRCYHVSDRYPYSLDVQLREAKTGRLVTSTTYRGTTLEDLNISISEVEEWLRRYVAP